MLSPRDVAERLKLSPATIRAALRRGELKGKRYRGYCNRKGRWVIAEEDFQAWLNEHFTENVNN